MSMAGKMFRRNSAKNVCRVLTALKDSSHRNSTSAAVSRPSDEGNLGNGGPAGGKTPLDDQHDTRKLRPFSEVPGPKGLPIIGNILQYMPPSKMARVHEIRSGNHKKFNSKILKETFLGRSEITVACPLMIEQIFRKLDKYPSKPEFLTAWKTYRSARDEALALLTAEKDEWFRYRSTLSKKMLRPKEIWEHDGVLNDVVSDLVARLRHVRDTEGDGQFAPHIPNELYKWSMESVCTLLFESRMGCLENDLKPGVQEFISSIERMLYTTGLLNVFFDFQHKYNLSPWRTHVKAWDTIFQTARSFIDKRLQELEEAEKKGGVEDGEKGAAFLTYLLASKQLSMKEIYSNMAELLLAGVDTTSNVLGFTIYHVSRNPEVQARLHDEVTRVLNGRIATAEDLPKMQYLKNVIRESMRMTPVVPLYGRSVDTDIEVGGYHIPANTPLLFNHLAAGRDEEVFERPLEFIPERWERSTGAKFHAFASLPFSFGVRGCIGRRLAELELHLALARISQEFDLKPEPSVEWKPIYRGVFAPGKDVPVKLIDRKKEA